MLLPILGDQYGVVLERGELKLASTPARGYFTLIYYEHQLPIDPLGLRRADPARAAWHASAVA